MTKKVIIGGYIIEIKHNVIDDSLNIEVYDELGELIEGMYIGDAESEDENDIINLN
jgi:hypothetical protein